MDAWLGSWIRCAWYTDDASRRNGDILFIWYILYIHNKRFIKRFIPGDQHTRYNIVFNNMLVFFFRAQTILYYFITAMENPLYASMDGGHCYGSIWKCLCIYLSFVYNVHTNHIIVCTTQNYTVILRGTIYQSTQTSAHTNTHAQCIQAHIYCR